MSRNPAKLLQPLMNELQGILLLDKPKGKTSFSLVSLLRKITHVKKIGHAGTLDPLATGLMVMLIGKSFTRISEKLLAHDKEYEAKIHLGSATDTYDCEGKILFRSHVVPSLEEVTSSLLAFQGTVLQTPPMFSAKKIQGKKLYELARKGIEIERKPVAIRLQTKLLSYEYPYLCLNVSCSKGTYIRCIAEDLGKLLGCGAHLQELIRLRSGPFHLKDCATVADLENSKFSLKEHLLTRILDII